MSLAAALRTVLVAALLSGCAGTGPSPSKSKSAPAQATAASNAPRTVNRNLSGYSVAFKQGYVAGCDSAGSGTRYRDEARYKSDLDYTLGWNDGFSVCRR